MKMTFWLYLQILSLGYYAISYFPGGSAGMRFLTSALTSRIMACFGRWFGIGYYYIELNYHGQDNADLKHRLIYSKISMFVATCHLRMREPVDLFATTLNLYCTHMVMNTFAVSLWPVVIAESLPIFLKQTIFYSFWLLQLIFNLKFIFKLTFIRIYIFKWMLLDVDRAIARVL
jgi:hypothetical protein